MRPAEHLLQQLEGALRGRSSACRPVLDELEQHVLDAVEAGEDEAVVVARLGDVEELARLFNVEAANRREARQSAVLTLSSCALIAAALSGPMLELGGQTRPAVDERRTKAPPAAALDPTTMSAVELLGSRHR